MPTGNKLRSFTTAYLHFGCLLVLGAALFTGGGVNAEGFPEKGNRADWSDAIPYYNLGNKYLGHQRYSEAATSFEDAVAIYPYDPDFYLNLGVAYRKLESYQSAEQAFKKAAELNEKDWMDWSNLANAYLKQNKYKETKAAFERTLTCNPPAAEKAAIQKDLTDLVKILTMQERTAATSAPTAAAATKSKSTPAGVQLKRAGSPTKACDAVNTAAPVTRQQLKDSGWDYTY